MENAFEAVETHPVLVAITALLILVVVAAVTGWVSGPKAPRQQQRRDRSGVWAQRRDLADLCHKESVSANGGIVLGRLGKWAVYGPQGRSVAVLAPTMSGKTMRLVVPNVLRHDGPVVVTSVKADVLELTLTHRERKGQVWIFDPTNAAEHGTCRWSPLLQADDYGGALQSAQWLVDAAHGADRSVQDANFWNQLGRNMLAPMLFAARRHGYDMAHIARWVLTRNETAVLKLVEETGDPDALAHWKAATGREHRAKDSVFTTAETILDAFAHPYMREALTISDTDAEVFSAEKLLDTGGTLYVFAPSSDQKAYRPVFEALISSVIRAVERRAAANQGMPIDPRLLLMLDEAGNVAPLPDLANVASAGANQGIVLVSVWQDAGQLRAIYGQDVAATVLSNHISKVYLAGISDEQTLRGLSTLIGSHLVPNTSSQIDQRGRRSGGSLQWHEEEVATPAYLRQLASDESVTIIQNRKPSRLKMAAWYEDDALRALIDPDVAANYDKAFAGVGGKR